MDKDNRDKMYETDGDNISEANGHDMEKDGEDKMYKDDGDNTDKTDGGIKGEADEDKTSKPTSTQNKIHSLEMLPLEILGKIFIMSLYLRTSNFQHCRNIKKFVNIGNE